MAINEVGAFDESWDAFISHSSSDASLASALVKRLEAVGLRCWIAPRNIRLAEEYPAEIMRGISASATLLLLHSESADRSRHVRKEVASASDAGKKIVSIRIGDFVPDPSMSYLLQLVQHVAAEWENGELAHQGVADRIRTLVAVSAAPPKIAGGESPGLKINSSNGLDVFGRLRLRIAMILVGVVIVSGLSAIPLLFRVLNRNQDEPPPIAPGEFPDPTTWFVDVPDKTEVEEYKPTHVPAEVTLEYINQSGEGLRLILFDCGRFRRDSQTSWKDFPFPGNGKPNHCNSFIFGKGWFLMAVRDRSGQYHYLGQVKLFDREYTKIEVQKKSGRFVSVISE